MTTTIITGDGCPIAYRMDGPAGAPVLLLSNSLGVNLDMWQPQMSALTAHFRVLRYDVRGHGQSGVTPGGYSIDRLGRDVIELLDALAIERVAYCGLSLGGMIGQWLGVRESERITRLVLANTASFMGPPSNWDARIETARRAGLASLTTATLGRWFTAEFREANKDAVARVEAMLLATDPQGYAGCCAAIRDMDMRRMVTLVKAPTLVIAGTRDAATPIEESRALASAIPHAELAMLPAAHLSNVEQPLGFSAAVCTFLQGRT